MTSRSARRASAISPDDSSRVTPSLRSTFKFPTQSLPPPRTLPFVAEYMLRVGEETYYNLRSECGGTSHAFHPGASLGPGVYVSCWEGNSLGGKKVEEDNDDISV
ncbi:hypothetical protein Hypma_004597 [Hypsizygus marmoreus]|uniref:Uncharacterized protein n=1 Tax=Hypsizygus marmoreus TaxID=39966 RepID=A0A369JZH0_HYPMA|nr:hypothetical protein Hypma_004597 [Hypsizygus marmoreus]